MTTPPVEPLRLVWLSADRPGLERWLARIGLVPDGGHTLRWTAGSARLVESPDGADRLVLEPDPSAAPAPADGPSDAAFALLGVGWATVETDRAATEFPMATFAAAPDDRLLGAFARRSVGDGRLVLLEPNTEGRLSATLARWGEGPVALYLASRGDERPFSGAGNAGTAVVSTVREGPFGPSVILLGGPITGPHVILVVVDGADGARGDDGTDPPQPGTIGA